MKTYRNLIIEQLLANVPGILPIAAGAITDSIIAAMAEEDAERREQQEKEVQRQFDEFYGEGNRAPLSEVTAAIYGADESDEDASPDV